MIRQVLLLTVCLIYSVTIVASQSTGTDPGSSNAPSTSSSSTMTASSSSPFTSTSSSSPTSTSYSSSSSWSTPTSNVNDSSSASVETTTSSAFIYTSTSTSTIISVSISTGPTFAQRIRMSDPSYIAVVTAIVAGFGMLILLLLLFVIMTVAIRHVGRSEPRSATTKKQKKGDTGPFYHGQEPQSAQYLVSSMSIQSFGSSPSDPRLENHVSPNPGVSLVHYNRGFEGDGQFVSPAGGRINSYEDGFKPIQIVAAEVSDRPKSVSRV